MNLYIWGKWGWVIHRSQFFRICMINRGLVLDESWVLRLDNNNPCSLCAFLKLQRTLKCVSRIQISILPMLSLSKKKKDWTKSSVNYLKLTVMVR